MAFDPKNAVPANSNFDPTRAVPVKGGFGARLGDIGLSLVKGAVAVPEAAVGVADLVTGGKAGKAAESLGFRPKEAKAFLESKKSDAAQLALQRFENAEGFTGKLGAAIENPSLIVNAVAESAPLMGAGGLVGRGIMAAATPRAVAGATQAASRIGGGTAAAIGEGIVGAGSAAEAIRQETADGELTGTQSALAAGTGLVTGLLGAGGRALAGKFGVGDIDTAITTGSTTVAGQAGKAAPGMSKRVAGGALAEGVLEELPQSVAEQGLQNLALDKPFTEDLDAAAAMGLVTGGAMGAGMGIMSSPAEAKGAAPGAQVPPVAPPAQPPVAPASGPSFGMVKPVLDERALYAAGVNPPATLDTARLDGMLADTVATIFDADGVFAKFDFTGNEEARDGMRSEMDSLAATYGGKVTPENLYTVDGELAQQFDWYKAATPGARMKALQHLAKLPVQPDSDADLIAQEQAGGVRRTYDPRAGVAPESPLGLVPNVDGVPFEEPAKPFGQNFVMPERPSVAMGLDPALGGMTAAAALAVDSGASPVVAQGFGMRRMGQPVDVQPITGAAGQIGTPRRLGETPIIDVEAREVKDQQAIAGQAPRVGMTPRIGFDSPTQGALNGPQADQAQQAETQRPEAQPAEGAVNSKAYDAIRNELSKSWESQYLDERGKPLPEATPKAEKEARARNLATLKGRMMAGRKPGALTNEGTTPDVSLANEGKTQTEPAETKAAGSASPYQQKINDARASGKTEVELKWGDFEVRQSSTDGRPDFSVVQTSTGKVVAKGLGDVETASIVASGRAKDPAFDGAGQAEQAKGTTYATKDAARRAMLSQGLGATHKLNRVPDAMSDGRWEIVARDEATPVVKDSLTAEPVVSEFTGKPDPRNSPPEQELDGYKVGDTVDIPGRTTGLVKIETLYKRNLAGFGPTPMARVMRDNGTTLDVATSELKAVEGNPANADTGNTTSAQTDAENLATPPASDLDAMFDDVLAEEVAKDEAKNTKPTNLKQAIAKQRAKRAPRTAGQATASAAKNTASALGNAIDGLGALFGQGPNADGTINLNSGIPVKFNAETYAKAKPLFQAAVANLGDAGRDMKEAMRAVVRMVMDKFGAQAAQNMKPYVVKFIEETSQGNLDTTTSQADTGTKENGNERTEVRGDGPQALGGMAAGEGGGADGGGPLAGRNGRSGEAGTNGGAGTDERGIPTARSGGSGTEAVYSADTRTTGRGQRGGRGGAGTEGSGGGVPGDDAGAAGNRRQVRAGVSAGGRRGAEATAGGIPATNFRITPELRLGQGGEVQKFKDNVAAIEVLKRIEAENRRATAEEQSTLARYVGWGGLANAFPDPVSGEFKDKWQERGEMLRELLTKDEYANARRSTQDAHYTSETVVSAMWGMARKMGFKGGLTLENSMGSGNFVGLMPEGLTAKFVGVEQDSLTARLAQALYPQATVLRSGLQSVPLSDNTFALNIGNPPFGDKSLRFQFKPEYAGKSIHNQFFLAGLDSLRPGGLQVKVVTRYLMDAQDKSARLAMAKKAKLVGLFRLPDNAFRENARTNVVTDIVIFQKLTDAEQMEMEAAVSAYSQGKQKNADSEAERVANAAKVPYWVETTQVPDPLGGEPMTVNAHFKRNPGDVLGVLERSGSMARGSDITVRLDDASQLAGLLERATARLPADIHSLSAEVVAATEARFKSMSDALRIALAKEEEGHLKIDADGKVQRVIERDTPEGDFELARQEITPDSPWSEQLRQDADGKWYRMEVVTGEDGKPVKEVASSGKVTKRNVYQREVFANEADIPASLRLGQTGYDRLVGIVKLRDLLKRQLELETADAPKLAMEGNRKKLATAYADFVAKHGPVNRSTNTRLADTMPDGGLVQALEVSYQPERTKEQAKRSGLEVQAEMAKPAPILKERVVPKYEPATKAASAADALAITLAETGRVDIDRIAQLLGVDGNKAADMLQAGETPLAFNDPETSTWETANNYLSGMVKRKLNAAKQAGLEKNVAALEKVQPEPWTAENVTVQMGSTWVPPDVYADFIKHLTGGKATVGFSSLTNSFTVDAKSGPTSRNWGTERMGVGDIVSRLLNSQAMVVRDTFSDGSSKINQEETSLAGLKAREVSSEFMDWVFQDGERRARLVEIFNDKFNTRVNRQYDGSHMMLPGKVPDTIIAMRRHQMNAIWRGIYERFMLVDHAVGAGKTFTAIARAMERRRMGLSRKPMIAVPNHLVEQWAADVYRLYPGAKVLAAGKKDFEAKRRRRLFGKVATGDWDIVIVPHSSFGQIGISPETEARFLEQEMELAKQAVADAWEQAKEDGTDSGFKKPFGVKEAERLSDKIQDRMDKLNSGAKDRLLTFEQLGVDDLTVDEAHEFKNLYYSSRLTGVRGMGNKTGAKKANDLYNKVRVLRETPTGSVAFLTGTPISNSAVEMFTVMRYLAADSLRESGMEHFDAWRAQYVEATPAFEPTESGRLKEVTRLGRTWSNMRSLMDLYYQFTDAVSLDDIKKWFAEDNKGKAFPVPKVKGGSDRKLIAIPPTPAQEDELKAVMAGFDGLDDIKDTMERNKERLRLMDRARKLSLDIRAVNPRAASKEEGGKLERVSQEVKRIYAQWTDDKGTQLIFLDRSVPKSKGDDAVLKEYDALVAKRDVALRANDEEGVQSALDSLEKFDSNEMAELRAAQAGGWNAYQQIKDNLVAMGIPANEIRFIQEATNDEQKLAMFDAVNGGKVRVLIGSTPRMGAGTNVQQRAVALHHVDVTWKPSDIEQREGRVIRQGNTLLEKYGDKFEVEIMAYATERTVDAKMWDLNATKLRTINGIRNYDGAFSMEFEDEEAVGMAEMAALASGNPMLLERVKLESELNNLELMQKAHSRKMFGIRDARDAAKRAIERNPGLIAQAREVSDFITKRLDAVEARHAERSVAVEGKGYDNPADALAATSAEITRQQEGNEKARYSVSINGQRLTNKADIEDAISAALGDRESFEAGVGGKTLKERTVAAREVAAMVNPELTALPSEGAKNLEVGEMLGYKLVAELTRYIDRGNGMTEVSLTLFDADGRAVTSETANRQPAMASYTTSMLRPGIEKLWVSAKRKASTANAEYLERQMQRAIEELPALEVRVNEGFPKAAEMAEKRARLANVVSTLSGKGQPDDGEAPAASRTRPVFSRAAQGQASNVVQGIVDSITARWDNAPKVVVAFDMDDPAIPERVRQEDQRQRSGGATGTPEGFYYKGAVYLMSSKLADPRDVVRVLFHEALGHYGLRGVFGRELKPLLQQIATMRRAQVEAKMKEYGLRGVSNVDRLVAAEEVLAEMAQDSPQIGFVRRAIATIKAWLRKHVPGFGKMVMTDDEIITRFILPARNFVLNGGPSGGPNGGPGGGVRFSRSAAEVLTAGVNNVRDMKLPAGYMVNDFMKSSGKLGWWHKTVGTQYNLAERSPLFKRVFDTAQGFLNDVSYYASEAANKAPTLLPKLETLKDLGKQAISAADNKAIAAPIFEGTLVWGRSEDGRAVRLADENDDTLQAGVVFTPDELRLHFGLNDKQIALYQEFRAATDKSLTNMGLADMVRFGGKDLEAAAQEVLAAENFGQALAIAGTQLRAVAKGEPKRAAVLLDSIAKMAEKVNKYQGLMDKGYAPLSRFGRHTLDVVDEGGARVYFGLFESEAEANKMARQMQANYPGAQVSQGTVSEEEHKLFAGVSPETVELFGEMLGLEGTGDEAADMAFQQYLKMAKANRSAMKRLIHRKGIAGFSEDPGRVLAGFVYSNARQTSSAVNMGELTQAVAAIPKGEGELKDHAVRLHNYVKNPIEEAQAFRGLLFAQYIGGSVASAIINTTQPFAVTMPWLSQFGGISKAAKQMGAAAKDALKGATGDAALDRALLKAAEDGIVSPQEVFQLQAQAAGRATLKAGDGTKAGDAMATASNVLSKLGIAWGQLFGLAEQFNRRTTFIAAYRTAVEQGMADPAAFAERAISETQFIYSKANKPRWARGAVGATLFTFKQYSISYVELMSRLASSGTEGKKAALLGLAILFLLSGAGGLPFAEDVDDVIDGIMQRLGYNFSTKQAKQEFFAELLGEDGAKFMMRGISGVAGVPVDVSGRFGMGNLIPSTGLLTKKADYTSDFMELAGPAGDLVKRAAQTVEKLARGEVLGAQGALATAAPLAGQNVVKAMEMANTGMYLDKKGRKVLDVDGYDATMKAIGFQPNQIAEVQDATYDQQRMVGVNRMRESEIADRWARGLFLKDAELVAQARSDLAQWNTDNPMAPIQIKMPQVLRRVRDMNMSKAERVAKAAPQAVRARVREELGMP